MEQTRGLFCTCDFNLGVDRNHNTSVTSESSSTMRALSSARCTYVGLYTRYQNNERPRALALLNSPLVNELDVLRVLHGQVSLAAVSQTLCRSWGYERLQNVKIH